MNDLDDRAAIWRQNPRPALCCSIDASFGAHCTNLRTGLRAFEIWWDRWIFSDRFFANSLHYFTSLFVWLIPLRHGVTWYGRWTDHLAHQAICHLGLQTASSRCYDWRNVLWWNYVGRCDIYISNDALVVFVFFVLNPRNLPFVVCRLVVLSCALNSWSAVYCKFIAV